MKTPGPLFERNVPGTTEVLQQKTVGIAGCGGLGSNAAVALVRAGIGRLILADHDRVEASNLNRQYFFQSDIGKPKVAALADHLRGIHPQIALELIDKALSAETVASTFESADLLIEAFDRAEAKQWLLEAWCRAFPTRPVVAASGLSGYGKSETIGVRSAGHIHVCGDEQSDMSEGLCAPRVAMVANLQANVAIELLLEGPLSHDHHQ